MSTATGITNMLRFFFILPLFFIFNCVMLDVTESKKVIDKQLVSSIVYIVIIFTDFMF